MKFTVTVKENVSADIDLEVEADTKEQAAQLAMDRWLTHGSEAEGYKGMTESVLDRWAEIDNVEIETAEDT